MVPRKKQKEELQPEISIGLVGHVDHGKTTLTEKLSGKWTDEHSEEIKRGITIRLGYADTVFRKCTKCKGTEAYTVFEKCPRCKGATEVLRKVSFVDAPGHETLMATMLSGANIMDGALLLVAANEECPQPQTKEHLIALSIMGVKHVVVVQNKIDLVTEEQAKKNYEDIKKMLSDTEYKDVPIIPMSAIHSVNIDALIEAIENFIPTPERDSKSDPIMFVARSFDINKPGSAFSLLKGGVLGGVMKQGVFKVGDTIELRPGRRTEENNQIIYIPITTKVLGLHKGGSFVDEVGPGGSFGVMTGLDPSVVSSDKLTGSVVGLPGKLPKVWDDLNLETNLLERVVGAKDELVVEPIKKTETLMLNVNSAATVGVVMELGKKEIQCKLKLPVCADIGARVTISRRVGNRWRLIGFGVIKG